MTADPAEQQGGDGWSGSLYAALAPELLDAQAVAADSLRGPGGVVDEQALAAQHVDGVLVSHDGIRWLPSTLQAIEALTRRPDHLLAVDVGSVDGSTELLAGADVDDLAFVPADAGFAQAVSTGLSVCREAAAQSEQSWVWVLHDDCAPEPDALRALLVTALAQQAAIVGPKLLDWSTGDRILELGVTIAPNGHRETGLDRDEPDQGQLDDRVDVLAVSTAGMLVRRDVWDALGGLDAMYRFFRDDVDLGWRARAAGHRVVVAPSARMRHAAAAASGLRPVDAVSHRSTVLDRRNALLVLLANATAWRFPLALMTALLDSLLRAAGFLVGRAPALAADELWAMASAVGGVRRLVSARGARSRRRSVPASALRPYLPRLGHQVRAASDSLRSAAAGRAAADVGAAGRHVGLGEAEDHSIDMLVEEGSSRRRRDGVVLFALASVLAVLGGRSLLGAGVLAGGALLPPPSGAADLWQSYLASWHPVGPGSEVPAATSTAVLALLALATLGNVPFLVDVVVLGAFPIAAVIGWWALGRLRLARWPRLLLAVAYGLLPVLVGAEASGRIGTLVLAMLAPVLLVLLHRVLDGGPWHLAWLAGLVLAVVTAFVPVLWPLTVAGALLLAAVLGGGRHELVARAGRMLVVAVVPAAVLGPWLGAWLAQPSILASESGLASPGLASPGLPTWRILLLDSGGPGAAPTGLLAGYLVAAVLVALAARPAVRPSVWVSWLLVLLAWLSAVLVSATELPVVGSGSVGAGSAGSAGVVGWPGPSVLLAGTGMLLALALALRSVPSSRARRRAAPRVLRVPLPGGVRSVALRSSVGMLALGALTVSVALGGLGWLAGGSGGLAGPAPLARGTTGTLPVYIEQETTGPAAVRALQLEGTAADGVFYTLVRGVGPRLGDAEVAPPPAAYAGLDPVVSDLVSGRGAIDTEALAAAAIGYILLAEPADPALVRAIDAKADLQRASAPDGGAVWRVERLSVRVRQTDGLGSRPVPSGPVAVEATLPASRTAAGEIVLAEPPVEGWRASVDGEELGRASAGEPSIDAPVGEVRFPLAQAGDKLVIEHRDDARGRWLLLQALAVLLVSLLALPVASPRADVVATRRSRHVARAPVEPPAAGPAAPQDEQVLR